MKVLTVNFSDSEGGAARAAYRLHSALLEIDVDSKMLVLSNNLNDTTVLKPRNSREKTIAKIQSILNPFPLRNYKQKGPFSLSFVPSFNVVDRINSQNADIVHLHWIHAGMMRIEDVNRIKAPIVWSMHDMWLFTGGCHYTDSCMRYQDMCGKCPMLSSNVENDISRKQFLRKEKTYGQLQNLTVVGLSEWLRNSAASSKLLQYQNVVNLPNPIDINLFKPIHKDQARKRLNLPLNKKLVLFGAMSSISDSRKGFEMLKLSLGKLKTEGVELVVFGNSNTPSQNDFGLKTHYLGKINNDHTLRIIYNVASVMVVPSLQENLSNAIMESLACGTPVVSFDIGGNADMIDHKENGYLAKPLDDADLAAGIDWVISQGHPQILAKNAREKVLKNFNYKTVAKRYLELYEKILKNQ